MCALPVPHETSPAATARGGARRIPPNVRRLVGRQLPRERATALVNAGQVGVSGGRMVWKVGERAVVQPFQDLSIPGPTYAVEPVRRVGTYEGAPSRIAMFPVIRDGRALMLTFDSGLELAWGQTLDMHRGVSALYAQPFMLIWRHAEGSIVHVPDLAAVIDGQLVVFEVKPSSRQTDPWLIARTRLAQSSLASSGVEYHLLSDVTRQRSMNLKYLSGYRRFNPFLAAEIQVGLQSNSRSIGGVVEAICRAHERPKASLVMAGASEASDVICLLTDGAVAMAREFASVRIGLEVALHVLATGQVYTDLDQPLRLSSLLLRQPSRGSGSGS